MRAKGLFIVTYNQLLIKILRKIKKILFFFKLSKNNYAFEKIWEKIIQNEYFYFNKRKINQISAKLVIYAFLKIIMPLKKFEKKLYKTNLVHQISAKLVIYFIWLKIENSFNLKN